MSKRPTAYDKGQHELICKALKVSPDVKDSGLTAYEAVCVLMMKFDAIRDFIENKDGQNDTRRIDQLLKFIDTPQDEVDFIKLYGTETD